MSLAEQIGQTYLAHQNQARATEFYSLAKALVAGQEDGARGALVWAEQHRASPRVQGILKSAVAAGSLSDPAWAGNLADYGAILGAFLNQLTSVGAFDGLLADSARVPLGVNTKIIIETLPAVAGIVGEGAPKPVTSLALNSVSLADPQKVVAVVVVTNELARSTAPLSSGLIGRSLLRAVARATDDKFVTDLLASVTPIPSSGATVANLATDIGAAYAAVDVGDESRFYWLMHPALAASLSARVAGASGWIGLTPRGGVLAGTPVLTSGSVPTDHMILVDASRIATATETITLLASTQGDVAMDTQPGGAGATRVSLWQQNLVALAAHRYFSYALLTDDAVAAISGMS